MKARFITEDKHFQRGRGPLKSMGIGRLTFEDIKKGSIIRSTKGFSVAHISDQISPNYVIGKTFPENIYFVMKDIRPSTSNVLSVSLIQCGDLKHAIETSNGTNRVEMQNGRFHTWGTIDRWEWYFDVVQRSELQESLEFNRDEVNPLRKMGIGIITWENMQEGTILHPKKDIGVSKKGIFIPPGMGKKAAYRHISPEWYLLVTSVGKTELEKEILSIKYYQCWDLPEAKSKAPVWKQWQGLDPDKYMRGTIKQFKNRFEIIKQF